MALNTNLVSYYKFDWNSTDSAWSNNWTDTNISYVSGKISNCASFNGTSSKITWLPTIPNNNNFSVNLWMYDSGSISLDMNIMADVWGWYFVVSSHDDTSDSKFRIGFFDTSWKYLKETIGHSLNTWIMYTITLWGWTLKLYKNWSLDNSLAVWNVWSIANALQLWQNANTRWYNWRLDEVGIWSMALTAWEVTQLYNWWSGLAYPLSIWSSNFFMFF